MVAVLVPFVRGAFVTRETFTSSSPDVLDGCAAPGAHRLLRIDLVVQNMGDSDVVIGPPSQRPSLFMRSELDGRLRIKDFVHYRLLDGSGRDVARLEKRSCCLIDVERIESRARSTAQFADCEENQGLSMGWGDVYPGRLGCQFVVIDAIGDGEYALISTTRLGDRVSDQEIADASVRTRLVIQGDNAIILESSREDEAPPPDVEPRPEPDRPEPDRPEPEPAWRPRLRSDARVRALDTNIDFGRLSPAQPVRRSITFEIFSAEPLTLQVESTDAEGTAPGVLLSTPLGALLFLPPGDDEERRLLPIWISAEATSAGKGAARGKVRIGCLETGESWEIEFTARLDAREPIAPENVLPSLMHDLYEERDPDALLRYAAPDFTSHDTPHFATEVILRSFSNFRTTLRQTLTGEDLTAAHWVMSFDHDGDGYFGIPATGRRVTIDGFTIARLRDGLIVDRWELWDTAALHRQMGRPPFFVHGLEPLQKDSSKKKS